MTRRNTLISRTHLQAASDCPHGTEGETEAQRRPKARQRFRAGLDSNPGPSGTKAFVLSQTLNLFSFNPLLYLVTG